MKNRFQAMAVSLVMGLCMSALFAQTVDFSAWNAGDATNGHGFVFGKPGPTHPAIVDTGLPYYGKVARFIPSLRANYNDPTLHTFYDVDCGAPEYITVDMDIFPKGTKPLMTIALFPAIPLSDRSPSSCLIWMMVDGATETLQYFDGAWHVAGSLKNEQWHHLRFTAFVNGKNKNNWCATVDGGKPKSWQLQYRNPLRANVITKMGALMLYSRDEGDSDGDFAYIDNVSIMAFGKADAMQEAAAGDAARVDRGQFQSKVLGKTMPFNVVLPKGYQADKGPYPVVYLFHGRGRHQASLTDDPKKMATLSNSKCIFVMPKGEDGWYIDSPVKPSARYNAYIEELMSFVESKYPISKDRARRGLTGWSMGGYGCTRFAQTHANAFGAVAPMIGLLDYPRIGLPKGQTYKVAEETFGKDEAVWKSLNPINFVDALKNTKIMVITGSNAFDRTMNENFADALKSHGIPCNYISIEGGSHDFDKTVGDGLELVVDFFNRTLAE